MPTLESCLNWDILEEDEPVDPLLRVLGVLPQPAKITAKKTKKPQPVRVRQEIEKLKCFGSMIGKARAFSSRKGDMPAMTPSLKAVDDIGQARRTFGKVGCIDLRNIA